MESRPSVIVLGGPNGSGKSTAAVRLLRDEARLYEFVNADVIARGLSAFRPEGVALQAGRLMLQRMDELAERGESFSLESTLASRTLAPWIARLKKERGYQFRLTYVWLHNPELNIARVHGRVLTGGHHIEDGVVRRRYFRSVANFFDLYCPLADEWEFYDNSSTAGPELIAAGCLAANATIYNRETWHEVQLQYDSRGNKSAD